MINIHSIEQTNCLPQDVMQGFEDGIYLAPYTKDNEILRDLHEVDLQHAIEYLVRTIGKKATRKIIAEQFKSLNESK
jgi:hypothetical protein